MRRGACPSLSSPMQTGDGLLARLNPKHGRLTARQLAGVANAAGRLGNGILEITARGSLQIRGLTAASAVELANAINALGIDPNSAPEIRVSALAGADAQEIADPRPVADLLRGGLALHGPAERLAPKISVIIDGGGALPMHDITADIRVEAVADDVWTVGIGGEASTARIIGSARGREAARKAVEILCEIARRGDAARGRDLDSDALRRLAEGLAPCPAPMTPIRALPIGRFLLRQGDIARGIGLAFGQISAVELEKIALGTNADRTFALSAGRALFVLGLSRSDDEMLQRHAAGLGFVTEHDDPRLRIAACAGAPACGSAYLATKSIARELVATRPDLLAALGDDLHLSGCAKQCAKPAHSGINLVGGSDGFDIAPAVGELPVLLAQLAERHGVTLRRRRA